MARGLGRQPPAGAADRHRPALPAQREVALPADAERVRAAPVPRRRSRTTPSRQWPAGTSRAWACPRLCGATTTRTPKGRSAAASSSCVPAVRRRAPDDERAAMVGGTLGDLLGYSGPLATSTASAPRRTKPGCIGSVPVHRKTGSTWTRSASKAASRWSPGPGAASDAPMRCSWPVGAPASSSTTWAGRCKAWGPTPPWPRPSLRGDRGRRRYTALADDNDVATTAGARGARQRPPSRRSGGSTSSSTTPASSSGRGCPTPTWTTSQRHLAVHVAGSFEARPGRRGP